MGKRFSRWYLVGVFFFVLLAVSLWSASRMILAKDPPRRITILYTNDTLGTLEPCG